MATEKKQSFFGGAAVLAFGIVVVKIIGAVFKIPLRNILGEAGSADFSNAYNIYATFLTISTAGLPVALSKMVSESGALGRQNQARRVFRVSFSVFLLLGVISFALMWWGNSFLAGLLHNPRAAYGIRALAPAVVCVGCLSAFRGYAQGCFHMTPTAVSQIIEALCKLLVGLGLALYLIKNGYPDYIAAAGAITGVTVGTVLSLCYMVFEYFRNRDLSPAADTADDTPVILKRLLSIAIPITLSSSMVSIITLIDTSLVQGQLQNALNLSLDESRSLYGNYSACMDLYNLPSSLMVALTASVIPAVSAALARKDRIHTNRVIGSSLRVTALIAFPMSFGLWALSEPIFHLFYPRYDAALGGALLSTLSIASLFVCIMLITNSILQAYGKVNIPIATMLIGGIVKIVLNYNLVAVPSVNIHGAPVGTLVCFAITALLNLFFVSKYSEDKPHYLAIFAKPLLASFLMALCAKGVYAVLARIFVSDGSRLMMLVRVGGAIGAAVVIYAILIIFLRVITADDLALLPKGNRLAKLLKIV